MYVCACAYLPSYSFSASIAKQSAPAWTACAATAASPAGSVPYTYCHAHTCRPPAFSAPTSCGLNWAQGEVPSPALTNTVVTPCALACATIALGSPPLDWLTYQIHMPVPWKVGAEAVPAPPEPELVGGFSLRTLIGPAAFDRTRPFFTSTRPELASSGTFPVSV